MKSNFTISNVLCTSWSTLLSQIWILAGLLIGYVLLSFILATVFSSVLSSSSSWVGGFAVNALSLVISLIFSLGYLKNLFQALDGDEPRFSAYGQQAHKIVTYFVSGLLYAVLIFVVYGIFLVPYFYLLYRFSFVGEVFGGFNYAPVVPEDRVPALFFIASGALCLLLPALYISVRFMFYQAFIVEDNAGIVESLKKSWKITEGHTLRLFLVVLTMLGIMIAGILVFIVGLFVALPLVWLMYCCVFRRLNNQSFSTQSSLESVQS
ncbi:MAG: DUF975 family protein [Tannerellaceae bacterium]|jgi:membrane-anchored glycerophosphoryl diester phosphodiesterase (GDPDase)|nr:DUF975 family protein [Tannerellaceae bacterium]